MQRPRARFGCTGNSVAPVMPQCWTALMELLRHSRTAAEVVIGTPSTSPNSEANSDPNTDRARQLQQLLQEAFADSDLRTVTWRARAGDYAARRIVWQNGFGIDGVWPGAHADGSDLWVGHLHADEPRTPKHPWYVPPRILGKRIVLRPWGSRDTPHREPDARAKLFNGLAVPSPARFAHWLAERQHRQANGDGVFWCIADRESDAPLGHIQLIRLNEPNTPGTGWLGYWLHEKSRGHGYVGEAVELLLPHAFADNTGRDDTERDGRHGIGLHRVLAGIDARNHESARVLRRAGFVEFSRERAALSFDGSPVADTVSFELLATDDRDSQRVQPRVATVLHTDRLRLRPWRLEDRPRVGQEPDLASLRFMPPGAQPTEQTYDAWLARKNDLMERGLAINWCIADRVTDEPLGFIGIFHIGDEMATQAEIGYWLHADARGHGYLTESVEVVVAHSFSPVSDGGVELSRLHAATDARNIASQKVLLGAGFHVWGANHAAYDSSIEGESASDGTHFELLHKEPKT